MSLRRISYFYLTVIGLTGSMGAMFEKPKEMQIPKENYIKPQIFKKMRPIAKTPQKSMLKSPPERDNFIPGDYFIHQTPLEKQEAEEKFIDLIEKTIEEQRFAAIVHRKFAGKEMIRMTFTEPVDFEGKKLVEMNVDVESPHNVTIKTSNTELEDKVMSSENRFELFYMLRDSLKAILAKAKSK